MAKNKTIPMNMPMNAPIAGQSSAPVRIPGVSMAKQKAMHTQKSGKSKTLATKPVAPAKQQNADAQNNIFKMMLNIVGGFSVLDKDVIAKNLDMASGKGMPMADRTIPLEVADYLMKNVAFIISGLVLNQDFRDSFVESVSVEVDFDNRTNADKVKARSAMKGKTNTDSAGDIILGVTEFTDVVAAQYQAAMSSSFKSMAPFDDEFTKEAKALPQEEKIKLGFIFSNFMYLLRAFSKNDMFMSYVVTVCESVKKSVLPADAR